ncbi:hypothetical protein [Duganella sp. LjRoot269]|uniref:hypothetical protein n=1 Tax=Duganella sp. LjRoot269 TaxID=3342305 RepID=UPI003ECE3842
MSRPTIKLPENRTQKPADIASAKARRTRYVVPLPTSPSSPADPRSTHNIEHKRHSGHDVVRSVLSIPQRMPRDELPASEMALAPNTLAESCTDPLKQFRPIYGVFKESAKRLSRITCAKLSASQETLARIYGYKNADDLRKTLDVPGYHGPYDDEHPTYWQSDKGQEHKRQRFIRAIDVIKNDCPWLYIDSPGPAEHIIAALELFSNADVQRAGFQRLNLRLPDSAGRKEVRAMMLEDVHVQGK